MKEYIPGDPDHNVKAAVENIEELYWKNGLSTIEAHHFIEAKQIIISALVSGNYDVVRKDN